MRFNPIPYRQPAVGDARCALYSIANLLGDRGVLLFNNVNESTNHLQETSYLKRWHEMAPPFDKIPVNAVRNIYPFAIAAPGQRIVLGPDVLRYLDTDPGKYIPALIDFARASGTHTMGALWGHGSECILIDPQHEFPTPCAKEYVFKVFEVVGVRWLTGDSIAPPEFSREQLSHIFKIN